MPRKSRKGYFVSGQFVAEGSAEDIELRRALKGGDEPSRSERKRESAELQKLGEELLTLRTALLDRLALPEKLREALEEARRISDFEGRRRQMQYIGKLMRQLDEPALAQVRETLAAEASGARRGTLALHQAEQWRDALLAGDAALEQWLAQHPQSDIRQLRALIRQARKDALAEAERPGQAPRHGKAYRELFQLVREQTDPLPRPEPESDAPIHPLV